ncbi:MAG TPA: phospholipase D family protein [Tepidisphaeraceae bacterium]|nr:phospholipase D family protein [Tepidisphaeraceae bacterium]
MKRIFSNGPAKDFVVNPFTELVSESSELYIAAPYVTETGELLAAAKGGKSVKLLAGLNASTTPEALSAVHSVAGIAVRYLTSRFHAKIYIFDNAALVGSSNLTDGGLRSNREATIRLDEPGDRDAIEELRALFFELWDYAEVLTREKLDSFTAAYNRFGGRGSGPDKLIEAAVGKAEPINIGVVSRKKTPERIFLEQLRRQVYEQYRPAFNEVTKLLEENGFRRPELEDVGTANETNRFLNWVRLTQAPGDEAWATAPLRSQDQRRSEILRLGREWTQTDKNKIPEDYIDWLRQVRARFGSPAAIEAASQEDLTEGLMSLHAFIEQLRFVKGGKANLPKAFWSENNNDVEKVKRTLTWLVHGRGDFIQRLHDVLYDPQMKLALFGIFCALELYGTVKPDDCPPMNGRIAKALRFLGFDVRGT